MPKHLIEIPPTIDEKITGLQRALKTRGLKRVSKANILSASLMDISEDFWERFLINNTPIDYEIQKALESDPDFKIKVAKLAKQNSKTIKKSKNAAQKLEEF